MRYKETKPTAKVSASAEYSRMKTERQQYLTRAHECAKLTIPTLIPSDTDQDRKNTEVVVEQPWQSIGSTGVNTLTAKLVLAILPANSPFFQLVMGRKQRQELLELEGEEADQFAAEVEAGLQRIEYDITQDIERTPLRTQLFTTVKHLLVAGNYLLYVGENPKGFPLYKYVVSRDSSGNVLKIIVREMVNKRTLDPTFLASLDMKDEKASTDKQDTANDEVAIFTVVERVRGENWTSYQEVGNKEVPGTRGSYTTNSLPWLALRMIPVDGEDYGRSYCEEVYGDLNSSNSLTKALVQGGMLSAKMIWLLNPNGLTDLDDIEEASNGDVVPGRVEDLAALRADKMADFSVAERTLQGIISRLERAYLMTSSVQRSGERVTAFEISEMTQELEDVLGGYYSLLAQELQLPIVRRWMVIMERRGDLPKLPKGSVEPMIVTGIDALGRGQDLSRLRGFSQDLQGLATVVPQVARRIKDDELIQRFANGHNVDIAGLIKSNEELAAEDAQAQEQQMQQSMMDKGTGPAVQAMAKAAAEGNQ